MSSRPTTVEEELAKTPDLLRFILPFLPNDVIQVLRSCANCCIEPSSCPSVNCLMPELADRLRKSITIAHRGTKAESQSSRSVLGNTNDDQPTQHNTINSIQVYTDTFVSLSAAAGGLLKSLNQDTIRYSKHRRLASFH